MNQITKLAIIAFLILCISSTNNSSTLLEQSQMEQPLLFENPLIDTGPIFETAYVSHDAISISSNSDFVTQGWPGYGNSTHPYVIDGLEITYESEAIRVSDTNASFIISNCRLADTNGAGVYFDNVTNGFIDSCEITDTMFGFGCIDSSNITVQNTTFSVSTYFGAFALDSNTTTISNCTFSEVETGVWIHSNDTVIFDNVFYDNMFGIVLDASNNCTIFHNNFTGDGIEIGAEHLSNSLHNITSNTINDKPLLYAKNQPGINIIGDYGQVIVANCTGANIENHEIEDTSIGIQVLFSDNSTLIGNSISECANGIAVLNSENVSILSANTSYCDNFGIILNNAPLANISSSIVTNNKDSGILITDSDFAIILDSVISNNGQSGIYVEEAWNLTIHENDIEMNGLDQIYLWKSPYSVISSNLINGSLCEGLLLDKSPDCTIWSNEFHISGILIEGINITQYRHNVSLNTINGLPLIYHFGDDTLGYIGGVRGQIILVDVDTALIQDVEISNVTVGLALAYCTNVTLDQSLIIDIKIGVSITQSNNCRVLDSEFDIDAYYYSSLPNYPTGIFVEDSSKCTINGTTIISFEYGFKAVSSNSIDLIDNEFYYNYKAVIIDECINSSLRDSIIDTNVYGVEGIESMNCSVISNSISNIIRYSVNVEANGGILGWTVVNNTIIGGEPYWTDTGIYVFEGEYANISRNVISNHEYGIILDGLVNSTIADNNVTDTEFGLIIEDSEKCNITGNEILWSQEVGIYVDYCDQCVFFGNTMGGNGRNAEDNGAPNQWDDGVSQGNIWSDYSGSGVYNIPGEGSSVDNYPDFMIDNDAPEVSSPPDISVYILDDGITVNWELRDLGLDSFRMLDNGSQIAEGEIYNNVVNFLISGFSLGLHNLTIIVNDTRGNEAWDTVMVTVWSIPDSIRITCNEDFETQNWPGSGTVGDPYRIENKYIAGDETCISIDNTTVHFVIRDCIISSYTKIAGRGISLTDVENGTVEDCTISMKDHGIYLENSAQCSILNNTIISGEKGITIDNCENITVEENYVSHNWGQLPGTLEIPGGIMVVTSPYTIIESNTLVNNTVVGVMLSMCPNSSVKNNNFTECGLAFLSNSLDDFTTPLENNLVNDKPIGHFINQSNLELDPDDYGQIYIVNCTDVSISDGEITKASMGIVSFFSANVTIDNVMLRSNSYGGIYAGYGVNHTINNCTAYDSYYGIMAGFLVGGTISNCTIACNTGAGLLLSLAAMNVTQNQIFGNKLFGIQASMASSSKIYDNLIAWNGWNNPYVLSAGWHNAYTGFSSMDYDDGVSIGNIWNDYEGTGEYYIEDSSVDHFPRSISDVTNPTINDFSNVEYELGTDTPTITWTANDQFPGWFEIFIDGRSVRNGTWFATDISFTPNFSRVGVYNITVVAKDAAGNYVQDTVLVTVSDDTDPTWIDVPSNQVLEYGSGFIFDFNATDLTGIASWTISDTVNFTISSSGVVMNITTLGLGVYSLVVRAYDASDNFCSVSFTITIVDTHAPTINSPSDFEYVEGTTGHVILWVSSDSHPNEWTVYLNGDEFSMGLWDGGNIEIDCDNLLVGTHNFTIVVSDTSGNSIVDTVFVTVTAATTPTTPPTEGIPEMLVWIAIFASSGIVIVIIVLLIRFKR